MERLRLYLVDDEPIILEGLVHTYDWESLGFTVAGSTVNPKKALLEIREMRPDVVITDVRMKGMTGLELIRRLKDECEDILYLVISAYQDFTYAQQACELGAFTYLLKPLEDEKLLAAVASAGDVCRQQKKIRKLLQSYEGNRRQQEEEIWKEELYLKNIRNNAREYISGAVSYIQEHLWEESLNIKEVAEAVHLNALYFGRIFKQCMDASFKQYLLEERMKKARGLLRDSSYTITEIGEQVGIPNPSYFTQQFKRIMGVLPTEYRREQGQ